MPHPQRARSHCLPAQPEDKKLSFDSSRQEYYSTQHLATSLPPLRRQLGGGGGSLAAVAAAAAWRWWQHGSEGGGNMATVAAWQQLGGGGCGGSLAAVAAAWRQRGRQRGGIVAAAAALHQRGAVAAAAAAGAAAWRRRWQRGGSGQRCGGVGSMSAVAAAPWHLHLQLKKLGNVYQLPRRFSPHRESSYAKGTRTKQRCSQGPLKRASLLQGMIPSVIRGY
jgi:hypothetical protein